MAEITSQKGVVLVAGVTGIVGLSTAELFIKNGYKVYGVSRQKSEHIPKGVEHHSADFSNAEAIKTLSQALKDVTHIIFATWAKGKDEEESCKLNGAMLENILNAWTNIKHVCLVTGTKHYLGPFEFYGKQEAITPFKESQPRLPAQNFYYVLEDILSEKSKKNGYTWTVSRPSTIIGFAPGNLMNLGTTVAVYATLCRKLNLPFTFPGSETQYKAVVDVTDNELLAEHLLWQVENPQTANLAFNVVNGDVFRWKNLWPVIAEYFQLQAVPYTGPQPLQDRMNTPEIQKAWETITKENNLQSYKLNEIAPFWHTDADLGRTVECINDMNRSKELGWIGFRNSEKSFIKLFDRLKSAKLIPQ